MAITQDRMIAMIDCAKTLSSRLEESKNLVDFQQKTLRGSRDDLVMMANMLDELHKQVIKMAEIPAKIMYQILREQAHFEASKKKNDIAREAVARWRRNEKRKKEGQESEELEFPSYLMENKVEAQKPKSGPLSVDLEDIIPLIDEKFADDPNGDKTLDSIQINESITEATDETNDERLMQITMGLLHIRAIQPRYKKGCGPEGVFIRGTKIGGRENAATVYGQELVG